VKDKDERESSLEMSKEIQARLERIENILDEIKVTASRPFDFGEAAAYLHHSKSHLYQLTSKGLIAHFKPNGKKIYFLKQDLDAYLLRHRRPAGEEIDAAAASYVANHPTAEKDRICRKGPSDGPPGLQREQLLPGVPCSEPTATAHARRRAADE